MSSRRWSRDELVLALDLYFEIAPRAPDPDSAVVRRLSDRLRLMRPEQVVAKPSYRSPDAVVMKLMNFRSLDPNYGGKGLSAASAGDRAIWAEFSGTREALQATVAAVGSMLNRDVSGFQEDFGQEGDLTWRLHLERERDIGLVRRHKAEALARDGRLTCEACGFDFETAYGERGRGVIDCHHVDALFTAGGRVETSASRLALLCANCHRIVHARRPWLSFDELLAAVRPR